MDNINKAIEELISLKEDFSKKIDDLIFQINKSQITTFDNISFDEQWYLMKYPDVNKKVRNPPWEPPSGFEHYIRFGKDREYRILSSEQVEIKRKRRLELNEKDYSEMYNLNKNHWFKYGESEQRLWKSPSKFSLREEFEYLKETMQWWPNAVDPLLICDSNSEDHKKERADAILDEIQEQIGSIKDKRFLDFGTGEGHVAEQSSNLNTSFSYGYDINFKGNSPIVTSSFEELYGKKYFDIISLWDVVDHLEGDCLKIFKDIKSIVAESGVLFVKCHPWCGIHGTHLYNKINKPCLSSIFTKDELLEIGCEEDLFVNKFKDPVNDYEKIFDLAGFKVIKKNVISDSLPFKKYDIKIIEKRMERIVGEDYFNKTKIEWVDYILQIK